MKQRSKYRSLFDQLHRSEQDEITLTFTEIEAILDCALPASARTTVGWWSNRGAGSVQAAAWMEAGYRVENVDLEKEQVAFRKPFAYEIRREKGTVMWNSDMIKALRVHTGWNQADLADKMGVRQQTVSEWETGVYEPSRSRSKHLDLIAEQAEFEYETKEEETE